MKRETIQSSAGLPLTTVRCFLLSCGCLGALLASARAQPYTFTTLAGRAGVYGSGDGTNGNAQFSSPQAVAVDAAGNLYVADNVDSTIRKVAPQANNWVVTTLVGFAGASGFNDGTNSNALFNQPGGIAVDGGGSLFVADTGNNVLRKVVHSRTNWIVTTLAGSPGVAGASDGSNNNALFNAPSGVAVDSAGNLYVADTGNNTIRRVSLVGGNWVVTTLAGLAGANSSGSADGTNSTARFRGPMSLALDGAGDLFVSDTLNHTIRKVSPSGTDWVVSTVAGLAGSAGSADGIGGSARFNSPAGIAVDTAGNFYVADNFNNALRKGALAGSSWSVSTIGGLAGASNFGSSDGIGSAARFFHPQGVAVDKSGNLYVADTFNATLRGGKPAIVVQISLSANSVMLSWPLLASNYVLETSTTLAPGASWTPVNGTVVTTANGYSVSQPLNGPKAFFRLRQ